jgi:hypothetical protein
MPDQKWYGEKMEDLDKRPMIQFAVEGAGVSPENVPLDQLVGVLSAANDLWAEIAIESDRAAPPIALTRITPGSACYALAAASCELDDQFAALAPRAYRAIQTRGRGHSPGVKKALRKLHKASREGAVSVTAWNVGLGNEQKLDRIVMALPLDEPVAALSATTEIYGRIAGVESKRNGMHVRLKPLDAPAIELAANESVAVHAARLFNQSVIVRAMAGNTHDSMWSSWSALSVERWQPADSFVAVMDEISKSLTADNVEYSAKGVLDQIRGDD